MLSKDYRGPATQARQLRAPVGREVVKYYTGEEASSSRASRSPPTPAQARATSSSMDWDGASVQQLTTALAEHPAVVGAVGERAGVHVVPARQAGSLRGAIGGGQAARRSRRARGSTWARAFSPDGSEDRGDAVAGRQLGDLSALDARAVILKRLTNNPFIDTSPTWSPDGIAHRVRQRSARQAADLGDGRRRQRAAARSRAAATTTRRRRWTPRKRRAARSPSPRVTRNTPTTYSP